VSDVAERAGAVEKTAPAGRSTEPPTGNLTAGAAHGSAGSEAERVGPNAGRTARGSERARGIGGGTVGRRVARILALPAVVVLLLLSLLAAGQVQDYRGSKATSRSVKLALGVQDLIHELQTERGITAAVLGGNPSFRPELAPSRALVDRQRAAVTDLVRNDPASDGSAHDKVAVALGELDGLTRVRHATDDGKAKRGTTFDFFTKRIAALSGIDVGLDNTADAQLRRGVAALQALGDLAEATAQERAFLTGVFSAGGFATGEFAEFASMRADREAAQLRFARLATPEQQEAMDFVFDTGAAHVFANFEKVAMNAADGRHIVVNPQSWWSGLTTVLDDLQQLQQHVGSQIQIRSADLQQQSARRIGSLVGFVVLCFAGSVYLALLASRSITRPLAALAAEADSVAADRLPAAVRMLQTAKDGAKPSPPPPVKVPARATNEIRSVASALDHLQAAAYGLATDQAVQRRDTIESMANLGRRNQNLIRRQLGFITSLEREEVDPAALANLFELDHLATRMRRNAASLLVLVEASTPRQWATSVSVADMIRAAVSEVEEYRRVTLRRLDEAHVSGSAVGSIAHLLAELIENGLTFSPPDMDVEVQGRRLVDGYLIAITDQGVGMSAEDLRRANARLQGEGDFIAAPTRFLGHFVVGKLARESGVRVELLPSPATGVTARVTLPTSLLLSPSATVEVRSVTDQLSGPRHSVEPAEVPFATGTNLLALPQRDGDGPQIPSPWRPQSFRRPVPPFPPAARGGDPNPTPPAGLARPAVSAPNSASAPIPVAGSAPSTREESSIPEEPSTREESSIPEEPTTPEESSTPEESTTLHESSTGSEPPAEIDLRDRVNGNGTGGHVGPDSGPIVVEHTANGLPKRTPRTLRPAGSTGPARRTDPPTWQSAQVGGSPADVGARMTALRAGLHRGQGSQAATTSRPADGSGNDDPGQEP
jgi:signal transduction histidine kinase